MSLKRLVFINYRCVPLDQDRYPCHIRPYDSNVKYTKLKNINKKRQQGLIFDHVRGREWCKLLP